MSTRALEQVKRTILSEINGEPIRVWLFGSRAKNTHRVLSDVDVALLDERGRLSLVLMAKMREKLEESTLPFTVDLVDLRSVGERLAEQIRKHGVPWNG